MIAATLASAASALALASAILGAGARRVESRRSVYLVQSAALAAFLAVLALPGRPHLLLGVLAALGLKCGWLGTRIDALARRQRRRAPRREPSTLPWLLAQGGLAALVHQAALPVAAALTPSGHGDLPFAAAAAAGLATIAVGLVATLRDREPLEQFLGLATIENGAALAAVALTGGRLVPFLLTTVSAAVLAIALHGLLDPLLVERPVTTGAHPVRPAGAGEAAP